MNLQPFEQLLHTSIGLDVVSVGANAVERAVRTRMRECCLSDSEAYFQRVCLPGIERQALIEAVVVPETWFFRDPQAFVALVACARDWLAHYPNAALNVLSIPSSTGEEPYSIVMALLDAGFAANRFRVTAIDISEAALEQARAANYGRNAFRNGDLRFRERYFTSTPTGHRLLERVRAQVDFLRGNLLDPALFAPGTRFAVVFCRNLLIYFDRATQTRAIEALQRMLDAHGALFVAPSEAGLIMQSGFDSLRVPLAFGFRASAGRAAPLPKPTVKLPELRSSPSPRIAPPIATSAAPAQTAAQALKAAHALADAGHLGEAAEACERFLHEHGAHAQAHYLLGLVRDTAGRHKDAAAHYRKALYLDPQHHEALVHLAFLLEQQGDKTGAALLRGRLQRHARLDKPA